MRNYQGSLLLAAGVLFLSSLVAGCGGANSSGSGGSGGNGSSNPAEQSNPVPTLASVSPASVTAGSSALTITLTGTNFISSSTALWNGAALPTTYKSATSLTAQISAGDLQTAGSATITVSNPAPGGGNSTGVLFTIAPAANPTPTLTSLSPNSAAAGSPALTLTVTGTDFVSSSTVLWEGNALPTTYKSATSLTAQVSADYLKNAGDPAVEVSSPAPGGGTSNGLTFTIHATTTPGATVVSLLADDLAWDPVNQVIYLALPSVDGTTNGNSIQVLNPVDGTLGALSFAGSEPNLISVSANSKYLYVGLNGASNVQRMTLPNLVKDITIPMGSDSFNGPFYAMDVQAAPNTDGTVAVVRESPQVSPSEEGGVVIYDDGKARPNVLCGWIQSGCYGGANLYDSIQWNADGSEMFAGNYEDTGFDFYTIPVTSAGFGKVTDYSGLVPGFFGHIHFDKTTGYVYDEDGKIINPANGTVVGTFGASGVMAPDGTIKRAFFVGQTQGAAQGTFAIESFDIDHFTPIATLTLTNVVGTPTHIIRWGSSGLAITTSNQEPGVGQTGGAVYLVNGSFVDGSSSAVVARPTENVQRTWPHPQVLTRQSVPANEVRRVH